MLHHLSRLASLLGLLALLLAAASPARAADAPISIPSGTAPTLDGQCPRAEYLDAAVQSFSDAFRSTGTVLLKHNGAKLYVCLIAVPGTFKERFAALYLDPQGDGSSYDFAKADDAALQVKILGSARASLVGSGVANGYIAAPDLDGSWVGAAAFSPGANVETAEFAVDLRKLRLGLCGKSFGLAAYHQWVAATGDDYGWPAGAFFDQPRTWQSATLDGGPCDSRPLSGKIAYIFRGDTAAANSFKAMLEGRGYTVALIPLSSVLATDFSAYNLTIIADDSGDLDSWGSPADSAAQVARITAPNRPIIGVGEGGYAFFGKLALFIGWPNGWHGPADSAQRPTPAPGTPHYSAPNAIPLDAANTVKLYSTPVNEVGIYLDPLPLPGGVVPVGLETPSANHSNLIIDGCRQLWGFSDSPAAMTAAGKDLFVNTVEYGKNFQCAPPAEPAPECTLVKTAIPPAGTTVRPGQTIAYTLTYKNCKDTPAKLADTVPADTIFVPGSASDGLAPGADGALIWPIAAGVSGSKRFKVYVADTQCHNQRTVVNRAALLFSAGLPLRSNVVSHPVECPPITLPNDQPPYAEQEVQIHPYPLVLGRPSAITVRLVNSSSSPQQVRVSFQASPERFGIGIPFNTFDQDTVTIPANGSVIVHGSFTPTSAGHFCIQIKIEDASPTPRYRPIFTQRNLDVSEDLRPGVPDTLNFKVANPSASPATINLVVINTCPGWLATVSPATLANVGPNGGDVRNAALTVTPPNPVTLGSGCHIDVQGWIGDELIGGIRKLDVPPVNLPVDVTPPWMEPEISFVPNPPVAGQVNQLCVELQNPLGVAKTVTVRYAVADFGAGIPFQQVGQRTITLPPNSIDTYCIDWSAAASGTLHRCAQVTLEQPGYLPMRSQRNVDLRRVSVADIANLDIPLVVGNPFGTPQPLEIDPRAFGIDPFWTPVIVDPLGDPPPDTLAAGQRLDLRMRFVPQLRGAATRQAGAPASFRYGDESRVEVTVRLGGEQVGGFSVVLEPPALNRLFVPMLSK